MLRIACLLLVFLAPPAASAADLAKARSLLLHGRYDEAAEIYRPLAAADPQAVLGLADCLEARGKWAEAVKTLKPLADKDADVLAHLARLAFDRGDYDDAARNVNAALKLASACPLALYVKAELARSTGRLEEAERGYRRLIELYNGGTVKQADSLRWIGRAAAQYARWNHLSDQFDFLVNELLPDSVKLDADYWPAHYEAGLLFMEKYNRADAAREFQAALEINPRAAEVHVARAELAMEEFNVEEVEAELGRAAEINPHLPDIWRLRADFAWLNDNGDGEQSLRLLRDKLLPLNPRDEAALGRIAACYFLLDAGAGPRFDDLVKEVLKHNPHPGEFYAALAEMLEVRNQHAVAEKYLREAIRVLPQQPEPHAELGLLLMRLGREAEARKTLEEAFDADPFHVRVKNSLDVLDVVEKMATRRTPRFVIKYDPADARLVPYLAPHLEKVYADLKEQYGFAPAEPTPVEVFCEASGQSGHAWFSARMIGLPYLGTVAASTGRIVALVSPGETEVHGNYAWARTLRHEMTHVFNLQQTGYNIPHWLTEGLAVYNEKIPRPYHWIVLLRRRAAAVALMDIDGLNAGFARSMESDDCQLAYCQSELCVEYMASIGGRDALKKVVAEYARTSDTAQVIERVFGRSKAAFQIGYVEFVRRQIEAVPVTSADEDRRLRSTAREKLDAKKYEEAAAIYAQGEHRDPANPQWPAARARVWLAAGDKPKLAEALAKLAELAPDDLATREKLAELSLELGDAAAARRWATEALEIQVNRAAPHRLLAEALAKLKEPDRAVEEFRTAVEIDPENLAQRHALAGALIDAHQKAEAKDVLGELLRRDPRYPGAKALLEKVSGKP